MEEKRCMKCMRKITGSVCPSCGTDNDAIRQDHHLLPPGTQLTNRYTVGMSLGEGGFGITYIGYDSLFDARVAIKEYYPKTEVQRDVRRSNNVRWNYHDEKMRAQHKEGIERFLGEAKKMAKLDAVPGIVRVLDTVTENETFYIVMDYVDGTTLKNFLENNGTMKFSDCVRLMTPLMQSLSKMHEKGLIHRDISPDNIMMLEDGSLWLLDFGAAKDLTVGSRINSYAVIKEGFSPAEQYTTGTPVGSWTDVYALTATIYYAVTGKIPARASDRVLSDKPLDFTGNVNEPLSEKAIDTMKRGMAVQSEDRIQTMDELLRQMKASVRKRIPGFSKRPSKQEWDNYLKKETERGDMPEPPVEWVQAWEEEERAKNREKTRQDSRSGQMPEERQTAQPKKSKLPVIVAVVVAVVVFFLLVLLMGY